MNITKQISKFFILAGLILLSGCGSQTMQTESTSTPTVTPTQIISPTPTPTPIVVPGVQPITPWNIAYLDQLYELGEGGILNTAVSSDGKYIAVLSISGIHLFDRVTYDEIYAHSMEMFPYFNDIHFSQDGQSIFFSNQAKLYRWDYVSDELKELFTSQIPNWTIRRFELSPNEERIIIITVGFNSEYENEGHNTALYDMDGNLLFDRYTCDSVSSYYYKFVDNTTALFAVHSFYLNLRSDEIIKMNIINGEVVASAMEWENDEGEVLTRYTGNTSTIPSTSEDFYKWISASFVLKQPQTDWEECENFNQITNKTPDVLYQDDRSIDLIIANNDNRKIVKLNPDTCEITDEILFITSSIYDFSLDGVLLATSDRLNAYIWDLRSGELKFEIIQNPNEIVPFSFNHDGSKFVMVSRSTDANEGTSTYDLKIWDTNSTEQIYSIPVSMNYPTNIIKTNNPDFMILQDSKHSYIWNIKLGELIRKITGTVLLLDPRLDAVWIPIQKLSNYQLLTLFYIPSGMELLRLPESTGNIRNISLNSNASVIKIEIINKNEVSSMRLDLQPNFPSWRTISSDDLQNDIPENHQSSEWSLSMYPSLHNYEAGKEPFFANSLLLIHDDNSVEIWNIKSQEYLARMQFESRIDNVVFSPGGNFIAVFGSDGVVRIFGVKE
jgi:hypothetical protein